MRKPEYVLACGLGLCDISVVISGRLARELEYQFDLQARLICEVNMDFQARLLPLTCGIRLVNFDGGDARGIILMDYLDALKKFLSWTMISRSTLKILLSTTTISAPIHRENVFNCEIKKLIHVILVLTNPVKEIFLGFFV
jgi:hypothetical protein